MRLAIYPQYDVISIPPLQGSDGYQDAFSDGYQDAGFDHLDRSTLIAIYPQDDLISIGLDHLDRSTLIAIIHILRQRIAHASLGASLTNNVPLQGSRSANVSSGDIQPRSASEAYQQEFCSLKYIK